MNNLKIIIAGGTGFIGQELAKYFGRSNRVYILTRQAVNGHNNLYGKALVRPSDGYNVTYWRWDGEHIEKHWANEIDGSDLIINLAGKSVNCRYNDQNKKEIINSRTKSTETLGLAIQGSVNPPKLWINAASATIYRDTYDKPQDEFTGEYKNDFSVQVCKAWEEKFFSMATPGTRKIALRTAITLGAGGVIIPYLNLLKYGLGGHQGTGKQMYSWVHIHDVCRTIEWLFEQKDAEGVFNCSSPNPVTNKEFMSTLRKTANRRFGLPAFTWMLKIGARIIGTEPELVLKSRWVLPTKLLATGFQFSFPLVEEALKDIINQFPRKKYHLF